MEWLWWYDYRIELTVLLMPSDLKFVAVRTMSYILSNMLDHLMHVKAFTEMINNTVDLSMLSVIICYFKHFKVTVLWNAESLLTVTIRLCEVINIINQILI